MPFLPIVVPLFPFVPLLPGVPPVLRAVGQAISIANTVAGDVLGIAGIFQSPQWGLYDDGGSPVIVSDTITQVEFRREKRISNAPQENGAFASYNKVSDPYHGRITFVQGGSEAARNAFLNDIESALSTLSLFSLIMPEIVYPNVNVIHHDFRRRSERGVTLLAVDVWVEEVRIVGTSQFTQTATPQGANSTSGGSPGVVDKPNPTAFGPEGGPTTVPGVSSGIWPTNAPQPESFR